MTEVFYHRVINGLGLFIYFKYRFYTRKTIKRAFSMTQNDSKPIRNDDARIQMLDEVLEYFLQWKESLAHLCHTKSEQGLHFIAWQTMFDLKVIYCKCMTKSISPGCSKQNREIKKGAYYPKK